MVQNAVHPDQMPVAGQDIASLPKEDRRSVRKIGKFVQTQYMEALSLRKPHAIAWIMVYSFLRGIHYFLIDGAGRWEFLPAEEHEVRAVTPIMKPWYRHVLGFMLSNDLGVTGTPVAGGSRALYKSSRAENIINGWIDDANIYEFHDRASQLLLCEGMVGYHRFIDKFRQQVVLRALPQSEIFPIPYDARDPSETHGLTHATLVTKQFLELQDELFEQANGRPPTSRMADKAKSLDMGMRTDLPLVGAGGQGGKFDGALALTTWMKGSEHTPGGEYIFMLGDEVFRHLVGTDQQTGEPLAAQVMQDGQIPIELHYYEKNPNDFWGVGLCESLLPSQFSADRQMTSLERNARQNKSKTFVDATAITISDVQDEDAALIPFQGGEFDPTHRRPVYHFPATQVGRDVTQILEISQSHADRAAGFRSGIVVGLQEGRTESGPATSLLSQNAMTSLIPVMRRGDRVWLRTYYGVLDMLRHAWPEGKILRISGPANVGRELKVLRDDMPWSHEVILRPRPQLPGGRNAMLSMLFELRKMPGPDGKLGTELKSGEFRQALREMNMLPPGINIENRAEARIQTRINLLIGDGQKSFMEASNPADTQDRLAMEDHRLAMDMLKDAILDDSWETYSPDVRQALKDQMEFHRLRTFGATEHPNNFDDDNEKLDSLQMENFLAIDEADQFTSAGEFGELTGALAGA